MSRFLILLLVISVLNTPLFAKPAKAQMCDTLFEVITTLRPPTFGFPTVWDAKYGSREIMTQLGSGVPIEGGTVMSIGRRLSKDDFGVKEIVMVELNRRGRALKEHAYSAKDAEEPIKMIKMDQGFIAISNMRGGAKRSEKWVRISWYNEDGVFSKEKIIKDSVFDYEGHNLTSSVEDDGFLVIIRAVNRSDEQDQNGVLMRFTPKGELVWRRAYRPGIPNMLHSVIPIDGSNYMAAGRIRLDDGRMAAWAMKLGYDGAVHWQRTYPRGAFSVFKHASLSIKGSIEGKGFLLAGVSTPLDDGPDAAWVMEVDAVGEPKWQRYYRRGDYALSGDWVLVEEDGRVVLMMNARATDDGGGHDHVRMLTLSPRGILIQDEAYFEGLSAKATDYVPGWNGERILTAIIQDDIGQNEKDDSPIRVVGLIDDEMEPKDDDKKDEMASDPIDRGWVFVATALDPYEDPCLSRLQQ